MAEEEGVTMMKALLLAALVQNAAAWSALPAASFAGESRRGLCALWLRPSYSAAPQRVYTTVVRSTCARRSSRCSAQSFCLLARGSADGATSLSDDDAAVLMSHFERRSALQLCGLFSIAAISPSHAASPPSPAAAIPPDIADSASTALVDSLPPPEKGVKRIFLCRHGQTENNRLGKMQGRRVDPAINDKGMLEASCLAVALRSLETPVVASSELLRAKMTADRVASLHPGAKRVVIPALDEIDFGATDGVSVGQARARLAATYAQWALGNADAKLAGGESLREVNSRALTALSELLAMCPQQGAVVAVTHSAYLRAVLALLFKVRYDKARSLAQENCCINVLEFRPMFIPPAGPTTDEDAAAAAASVGDKANDISLGVGSRTMSDDDFERAMMDLGTVKSLAVNDVRHLETAQRIQQQQERENLAES